MRTDIGSNAYPCERADSFGGVLFDVEAFILLQPHIILVR
jgi:hypothetical protein